MPLQSRAARLLNRKQRLFNLLQSSLPQHLLSRLMYVAARWQWRPWKNLQIRWFIRHYGVNMQEAVYSSPDDYSCFNDFFTRALKTDARPLAPGNSLLSPIDGSVSQAGRIQASMVIQAKGHDYSLGDLLAGDRNLAGQFIDGSFACLYLSPRDYHRIHMPCSGRLQRMIHIPGRRFAVNEISVADINNLFARNERLINIFATDTGPMALIMVGAMFVGSMQTVWTDTLPSRSIGEPQDYDYRNLRITLERGEEMGRFNMGSTVILLFPAGTIEWSKKLSPAQRIHIGEAIGKMADT
ncbi:MAG: archaetidylserine decarboxylase [Gammaproteobacteria bacterium]|nr:archaetidylserine decarboxylase [Gammaproteobacteria bacterium]